MPEQNYNQLVLAQLQSLSQAMEALRGDLQFVRQEITELKAKEDKVIELREWKQKIDDVVSPTQLYKLVEDIKDLNLYEKWLNVLYQPLQNDEFSETLPHENSVVSHEKKT